MITVQSVSGPLESRSEFAASTRKRFGSSFSRPACDELYGQLRKIRRSGREAKLILDAKVGRFFAYDPHEGSTGVESLLLALCDKYKDPRKVPLWLAQRAILEPIELALCGIEVKFYQVLLLCDLFPLLDVDPGRVWSRLLDTVAMADAMIEKAGLEAEAARPAAKRRTARL